jgi:peptidoglycan hydrolase-like protein with peptidoglycan-binding domain
MNKSKTFKFLNFIVSVLVLACFGFTSVPVLANNNYLVFDKNFIISNTSFLSYRDFPNAVSIQRLLETKNSFLKNYSTSGLRASDIIFKAANGEISSYNGVKVKISPALLLTMLDKEQSLLSTSSYDTVKDPQRKLRSAMGYACPDTSACNPDYEGFYKQVTWGAYQLQYNFNNARNPKFSPYTVGTTFTTLDNLKVTISNEATASLYRYTPHVYMGNYNVFKIMMINGWTIYKQNTNAQAIDAANKVTRGNDNCQSLFVGRYYIGQTGKNISELQQCLKDRGMFNYPSITGYFGPVTNSSLSKLLDNEKKCERFYYKDFKEGQASQEIRDLQQCLIAFNVFPLNYTTGYFGPVTKAALIKLKTR